MAAPVWVYAQQGIYTCIDAQGQRITADRPIAVCRDREQRILSPSGVERARVGPVLTEHEQAERRQAQVAEQRRKQQAQELLRREAVLLARYPDRASHDAERQQQQRPFAALMELAQAQLQSRQAQHQQLQADVARHQAAAQQVPVQLVEEVRKAQAALEAQAAYVRSVQADSEKVQRRFDEELARLEVLWLRQAQTKGRDVLLPEATAATPAP